MLNMDPITTPPPTPKHPSRAALIINANDVSGSSLNRKTMKLWSAHFQNTTISKDVLRS